MLVLVFEAFFMDFPRLATCYKGLFSCITVDQDLNGKVQGQYRYAVHFSFCLWSIFCGFSQTCLVLGRPFLMHHSWQDMNAPSGKSQDTQMTKLAYSSGNGDLQNEKFQEIQFMRQKSQWKARELTCLEDQNSFWVNIHNVRVNCQLFRKIILFRCASISWIHVGESVSHWFMFLGFCQILGISSG